VRICVIGKFPPIQGGVSMRTYWSAHALAARGHEVHVVTNAKEVRPPFRMHMRAADWARCASQDGAASLTVHWSDPLDHAQAHIPLSSAFVTKLATLAARAHAERPFDVIYSHYLEPYGIAGHLAAQMTGVPHVVRMAGSDAGRLWLHPQFELIYDHVLRSAELVIATGPVAERTAMRGVAPDRIAAGGAFVIPEHLFMPEGPHLDLATLRQEVAQDPELAPLLWGGFDGSGPCLGVYGKLGRRKGSFALLEAMHRLDRAGVDVGLLVLGHGVPEVEAAFRARAEELGLVGRILQIPFLPHWRVPEFLRRCVAVCCFEQDFPIEVHAPIIPREVLMSGRCLVASTELIRKLPSFAALPHGYGCVAIEDVNDADVVSEHLAAILEHPAATAAIGARGRAFGLSVQRDLPFPQRLEMILDAAARRQRPPGTLRESRTEGAPLHERFLLTRCVAAALAEPGEEEPAQARAGLPWARAVLNTVERSVVQGSATLRPLCCAVEIEIAVAAAEDDVDLAASTTHSDPVFRLQTKRLGLHDDAIADLIPQRDPQLRVIGFDFDVAPFLQAMRIVDLPAEAMPRRSFVIVFASTPSGRRDPLVIDALTAGVLRLSEGVLTVAQILAELGETVTGENLAWIESLFRLGLVSLGDSPGRPDATVGTRDSSLERRAM
jgi:glycosyltransferase involved in cell wall biosynthesis